MAGVRLSKDLATKTKQYMDRVDRTGPPEGPTSLPPTGRPRDDRTYMSPAAGFNPASVTDPQMQMCVLHYFDGTNIVPSTSIEQVWSQYVIPGNTLFRANTMSGRTFAIEPGGQAEIPPTGKWATVQGDHTYPKAGIVVTPDDGGPDITASWTRTGETGEEITDGTIVSILPTKSVATGVVTWFVHTWPCDEP